MREKHSFSSKCKNLFFKLKNKINTFKNREKKPHPHLDRAVVIMNKYSLVFHLLLSCFLVLVIECISRRNVLSAFSFIAGHTIAYLYNSFIIFASLSLVYLIRRRTLARLLISGFWLFLGTINGVLIGIMLSFTEMIIRTAKPARCFLGIQTGHSHFRDLKESSSIHAVEHVVIYRFSSNLCFANVSVLQKDIEDAIREDTRAVILDAGGIGSIDITAADCLERLYGSLKEKGIRFYMTEHIAEVNEQLRRLGLGYMVEEGCVRRTIHIALKDMGIRRPYPLEGGVDNVEKSASRKRADNRVQEFVWAFGSEAEQEMEKQIARQIAHLTSDKDVEELIHGRWSHMEALDEDEWLEHLEEHLKEIVNISGKDEETLAKRLEEHRQEVHDRIAQEHPELAERFRERRHLLDEHLRERRPEVYELVIRLREKKDQA